MARRRESALRPLGVASSGALKVGFYIRISKVAETDDQVIYVFEGDHGRQGKLSLDKATRKASLIDAMPSDDRLRNFSRAAYKVERGCVAGVFPDLLEWAS